MTPDEAKGILAKYPDLQDWLGVEELDPRVIAAVFADIEGARRGNPELARRVVEAMAGEFDRLTERLVGLFPEPGDL